jgi:hypothetical protein
MAVIPDFKNATLVAFLKQNVASGSTVYTDGLIRASPGWKKLVTGMSRAFNPCEPNCGKARSRRVRL